MLPLVFLYNFFNVSYLGAEKEPIFFSYKDFEENTPCTEQLLCIRSMSGEGFDKQDFLYHHFKANVYIHSLACLMNSEKVFARCSRCQDLQDAQEPIPVSSCSHYWRYTL